MATLKDSINIKVSLAMVDCVALEAIADPSALYIAKSL